MKKYLLILVAPFLLSAQGPNPDKLMSQKEIKMLIDSISLNLKKYYIYPDKAALIEKTLKENHKNGAYKKLKTPMDVANTLHTDIRKAHYDGHMRLMYFPDFEKKLVTVLPDSLQKKEAEKELQEVRSRNFYFVKTEILPADIAYIRWDGFVGQTQEAKPTFESAFQFVCNAKALIIDMRYNGGGSPETVNAMLNYFFDKRLPMNHIIGHMHDTNKHYTDPALTSFKLKMPVYILTCKNTFSGAEDFTYAMKVAKRATIVGDTTGGGAHPTGPCTLGQGFVLNIPDARSWHELTNTNWEGTGIYPDIYADEDQALIKAKMLIYKDMLAKAQPDEKNYYQWFPYAEENKLLLAKQMASDSVKYSLEQLQQLCGKYVNQKQNGSVNILLKGTALYIHFNDNPSPDQRLIPVGNNRFAYNEDVGRALDFAFDKEGKVVGITNVRVNGVNVFNKVK
jgi:hypothetical protein